eukprot:jgi/Ulvmu1/6419/UM003_0048.1
MNWAAQPILSTSVSQAQVSRPSSPAQHRCHIAGHSTCQLSAASALINHIPQLPLPHNTHTWEQKTHRGGGNTADTMPIRTHSCSDSNVPPYERCALPWPPRHIATICAHAPGAVDAGNLPDL